jgi:hypothetical protein
MAVSMPKNRAVSTTDSGRQQRIGREPVRVPWLSVLGGVLLFCAWAVDNYLRSDRTARLREMDLAQEHVSTNEILKNQWETVLLQARLVPEPDSLLVAEAALHYIQFASNVVVGTSRAITPSELPLAEQRRRREEILDSARARFAKHDLSGVVSLASMMQNIELHLAPDLTSRFADRYGDVKIEEKRLNSIFLLLYVLGSLVVGAGYLWSLRAPVAGTAGRMILDLVAQTRGR